MSLRFITADLLSAGSGTAGPLGPVEKPDTTKRPDEERVHFRCSTRPRRGATATVTEAATSPRRNGGPGEEIDEHVDGQGLVRVPEQRLLRLGHRLGERDRAKGERTRGQPRDTVRDVRVQEPLRRRPDPRRRGVAEQRAEGGKG